MNKLNKLVLATAASFVGAVNAGEITSWTYINEAGFSDYTQTTGTSVVPTGDATPNGLLGVPAYNRITWGQGLTSGDVVINEGIDNRKSGFRTESPQSGAIDTNGVLVDGVDMLHNNWVVGQGSGLLTGASFLDGLQLIPTEMDGVPYVGPAFVIDAPVLGFEIDFIETANGVDYDLNGGFTVDQAVLDDTLICPDGTLNGTGVNVNGCADIFAVTSDTLDFEVVDGNLQFSGSFLLDLGMGTYEYTITTILSGLQLITDEACVSLGLGSGCFGFLTQEETSNRLVASFKIESSLVPVEVSAPATLGLFGLALLGLGGLARRKSIK